MKLKHLHTLAGAIIIGMAFQNSVNAQCGIQRSGGSAYNVFTLADNFTTPIAVDKDLNSIVFIHRHNSNTFGGNSGNLRYDISTNGGSTWTNNLGVLNPVSSSFARYPSAAIYNPAGNTTPGSAYMGYMAATVNQSNNTWNGVVQGVRQLNGATTTEVYNQPAASSYFVPSSVVKGAPGVFWSLNFSNSGNSISGDMYIYKGLWNNTSNTINWAVQSIKTPGFDQYFGYPFIGDYQIAFDPTGTYGWISVMGELSGFQEFTYRPIMYKTTDGGATWEGPIEVPLYQFGCITQNVFNTPTAHPNTDLTVDMYGNPHLLALVGSNDGTYVYDFDYSSWHHFFDITQQGGLWTAMDISSVMGGKAVFYGSVSGSVPHNLNPQISRSADGSKIFFGWTDNASYYQGQPNDLPDLFVKGYDVQQNKWTPIKNFTACNPNTSGLAYYMHMAEGVLEPSAGMYKLAPVYAEFTNPSDADGPVDFKFLDNATFLNSDFNIFQPTLNVSITQGNGPLIMCPGTPINLQITGNYPEVLWDNGNSTNSTQFYTAGKHYVAVRSGCLLASDSITIKTLTMDITPSTPSVCAGTSVTINVTGNAYSYTMNPGQVQGTSMVFYPTPANINNLYVTGQGDQNCTYSQYANLTLSPKPTAIVVSNKSHVCPWQEVVLQATGNNISLYAWSTGATTPSTAVSPTATTVYSLTVVSPAGCTTATTITQQVDECTGINTLSKDAASLTLYPNPSAGDINMSAANDAALTVINELGQVVRTISLNNANGYRATITGLTKGIYFVSGQCNGQPVKQKIVIE